jgi:hypothetical protein
VNNARSDPKEHPNPYYKETI